MLTAGAVVAAVLALCGLGYCCLCLWAARRFLRDTRSGAGGGLTPAVSILKPLRGADPEMYEAFRSHCLQDYPEYELIFGVASPDDPAAALVERLRIEFPARCIHLVHCPTALGPNLKVSSLVQMLPHARHDYLLVNDSDIRVPVDYLRRIMAPFSRPEVGMVTALYRGAAAGFFARLEAIGISTDFAAGVLSARWLEGIRFGLGSTLAFPRRCLQTIGGLEPLVDYLGDDYELGARISAQGDTVVLSEVVVDTHLPAYTFVEFWRHQLRWARTMRDARRWGYLGVGVTFALPWSLLALALAGGAAWAWALVAVVAAFRVTVALAVGKRVLRDPLLPASLWLLPLRDMLGLLVWAGSYLGRTVIWRGERFVLQKGKLRHRR